MNSSWEPANDTERAMLRAAAEADRQAFFRLVTTADLYLPQLLGTGRDADGSGGQQLITAHMFEQTFLLVFTSVQAMAAQLGDAVDAYTVTTYPELRRKWPEPQWRLAVNPGTPLDAYLPVEAVEAAALGDVVVPTMADVVAEIADDQERGTRWSEGGDDRHPDPDPEPAAVDAALIAAVAAGDVPRYIETLLDAVVLVPATRSVAQPEELLEPTFPWRRTGPPQAPVIEVFTSTEMVLRAYPEPVFSVPAAMPFVLACWPDGCGLSVNPSSPAHVALPADQVQWLLMWGEPGESGRDGRGSES